MLEKYLDYKLCYIDDLDSYDTYKIFFTNKFDDQWGDDWNDRPACSNAGEPYTEDRDIYSIIISIEGYNTVTFGGRTYSVEDMNTKKACWLLFDNVFFEGGDTLSNILDKIKLYNNTCDSYNRVELYIKYGDDK